MIKPKKLEQAWALDQRALFNKDKRLRRKLWSESVSLCKDLLKKYKIVSKDRLQILTKLATIYQHQHKFSLVKKYLDIAAKESKNNPIVIFNYANLYRAMNQPKKALVHYQKAAILSRGIKGNEIFMSELNRYKDFVKKK